MKASEYLLRAQNVHKSFGATPALRGADLDVEAGEVLAIMGPSGSGKSTLLHCLAGIFTPDSGEIWFAGQRIDRMSEAERTRLRRTAFGFVFQFGQLVPELTAEDNIALPLLLNKVSRREAYARARQWFARLGIEGMERHRTGELSGGQAQRVAIARALIIQPKVVFADEPLYINKSLPIVTTANPLAAVSVIAAAAGVGVSVPLVQALAPKGTPVVLPGRTYYLAMAAGLAVAVLIISLTLPLLKRVTDPNNAQFE